MSSRQTKYEEAIGKRVSEKMLDHELDRFIDMDGQQLQKRLDKITSPLKLEAFRQMAIITKKCKLYYAAKRKLDDLYFN